MSYFTVCIPTYNRAYILERALESLKKQTFKDFEVVVVDDGSTDKTEELMSECKKSSGLNIRYFRKENGGKHTALNVGINEAKGVFFIILDSDDYLDKDALQIMKKKWENEVLEKDKFCGIMGKCADLEGKLISRKFPMENFISSYIDFHFISGFSLLGSSYGDCCECLKTEILQKYCFPENEHTKFVPEAYIMDQIGVNYKILCTNTIFKYNEYMADGITNNNKKFKEKNIVGFIIKYVSTIDDILPAVKLPLKAEVIVWWQYWSAIRKDTNHYAPRCKSVTFFGHFVKIITPILSSMNRVVRR